MTALATARVTESKSTNCYGLVSYKVAAATKLYAGGMVMLNSAGYAVPAAAAASNKGVCGVATKTVDNTAGAAGDLEVICECGRFRFVAVGLTQAQVGSLAYASDDQTFSSTQATNQPKAGRIERLESSTDGWICIDPMIAAA